MQKYLISLIFISLALPAAAQMKGTVTDTARKPVVAANIFWIDTDHNHFTLSENDGSFAIDFCEHENQTKLVVNALGYSSDTIIVTDKSAPLKIILHQSIILDELTVTAQRMGTITQRNNPIHAITMNREELSKAACCNLSESFETNASVDVSYSDAVTGAKQIRLLGLSGRYVQMMTENAPNFRGIAAPFGLTYIPGSWIESIQISKGTSSVLNGYEAITGQINLEYLKPQRSKPLDMNLYINDEERVEINAVSALKLNEHLSTALLTHVSNDTQQYDMNGDGFFDKPNTKQYSIMNRWNYETARYHGQIGFHYINEERRSGQTRNIENPYLINIDTERFSFFAKNGYVLNPKTQTSLGLVVTGSYHKQKSVYGVTRAYDALQKNIDANLIFETNPDEHHKLNGGLSVNADDYKELAFGQAWFYDGDRLETTAGAFAQYTFNFHDKFIALAGLRADRHNLFGTFFTPRLHLKYNLHDRLILRASAGKGYRTPNVLAENSNVLVSNRTVYLSNDLKQEEAWNYGIGATAYVPAFRGRDLMLSAEWYYTGFLQQTVVDMDRNPREVHFYNLNGNRSYAGSIQLEATQEMLKGWTITLAHRITDTRQTIGGTLRELPLTSRYKSMLSTSYQTPKRSWQFDFTAQFNGGGRLPDPEANNPLWDKKFKPYTILLGQITKYFNSWSVYVGSENLTGFTQKRPIIGADNPQTNPDFDASMLWGPLGERMIYVGLRVGIN